jgi:hypothetical protein
MPLVLPNIRPKATASLRSFPKIGTPASANIGVKSPENRATVTANGSAKRAVRREVQEHNPIRALAWQLQGPVLKLRLNFFYNNYNHVPPPKEKH